jgi:S-DNA-T family DNA segregation ATPase FtsK/SpoIIIE
MAVSEEKKPVLSPVMAQFLRHRLMEIFGLLLIILGIILVIVLASAGTHDPSFNRVSDAPVLNLLGSVGANISAILFGATGLAAFILALTPILWGARYLRKQPLMRLEWRIFFLASQRWAYCGQFIWSRWRWH